MIRPFQLTRGSHMAIPMTDAELLADAEAAYHQLMTGKSVVQFRDSNGEVIQYNQQSAASLNKYIFLLRQRVFGGASGPMRVWF